MILSTSKISILGLGLLVSNCAGMFTLQLDGYVSALVVTEPQDDFTVGQVWTIEIVYDEDTEDSTEWSPGIDSNDAEGSYGGAVIDFKFESGDFSLATTGGNISIFDDNTAIEISSGEFITYDSMSFYPQFSGSFPELMGNLYSFNISFLDRDAEVFDSDELPTSTPILNLFESRSLSLAWLGEFDGQSVTLETTSLSIVPESSTFALGAGGLSLLVVLLHGLRKNEAVENAS